MKLLSIRLENVRRFSDPVAIDGIGEGLNLVCEPNERGKSTVFDALHALFFMPHRSRKEDVRRLQPHAGGAPEVTVEIETGDGRFRIEKRWISGASARVFRGGNLIAQADEAEEWIAGLIGDDGDGDDGGPSGLLWVRQGETRFPSDARRDPTLGARRDLLSSVTGEVEAMTGGRRMDAALARCRDELGNYVTATDRPKTGGPLKLAEETMVVLTARRDKLAASVAELRDALDSRRQLRRELAEIEDPEAAAARRDRLDRATAAHRAAEAHTGELARAAEAVQLATMQVEAAARDLDRLHAAGKELTEAGAEAARTTRERGAAEAARADTERAQREAETAFAAAAEAAAAARRILNAALLHETAAAGRRRRDDLLDRIARAEALRRKADEAAAEARIGPDEAAMRRLEKLDNDLATARALHEAAAPSVSVVYLPGAEGAVTIDGAPLPADARRPVPAGAELALRGIGRLTIRPGEGVGDDQALRRAGDALAAALAKQGVPDLDAARAAAAARTAAAERQRDAEAQLSALAPDGIDALRTELAGIPEAAPDADLPPSAEAQAASERADTALAEAERQRDTARDAAKQIGNALAGAVVAAGLADGRAARALAAMPEDADAEETRLSALSAECRDTLAAAGERHAALAAAAPDLVAAEAALRRARAVCDDATNDLGRLKTRLAELDTLIELRSAREAVEEELAEVEARLATAATEHARIAFEVEVLKALRDALESARTEARERYFEPVMRELTPMLQSFWPDAEPVFDDATLLPASLVRRGQPEPIDILSGGTQEQIAILVRLAFARLLAARGRAAPVILDDAIVHTDDHRIERLFDALNREADRLQIIVLSCRNSFRELGGRRLRIEAARAAVLEPAE